MAIIAVLMLAGTGVLAYRDRMPNASGNENIRRLAHIVGTHRLTRARLTGGFAYAACQLDSAVDRVVRGFVCRGEKPSSWSSAGRLSEFAADMRGQSATAGSDAHASGVWELVWGHVDNAVADLRAASRALPPDAGVFNDLAVALTAKAEHDDDPSALIDAFVAADSAVRIDGSLKEAQFTLAVLLERLYLRQDAIDAWDHYLQLDRTSPWAEEARQRVKALQPRTDAWTRAKGQLLHAVSISDSAAIQSIVREHRAETRALVQQKLGEWGTALSAGDTATARANLDIARTLAAPLRAATGDALLGDAVAAIDRDLARGDPVRVRALANGHAALARGEHVRPPGRSDLATARKLLAFGGSPMSQWARLQEALAQAGSFRYDSALAAFRSIRDSASAKYLVLRSTAAQYEGFVYNVRSDYAHVMSAYDTALAESRTTDDPNITPRVAAWLASVETLLRGKQAGWRRSYAVLAETPRYATYYSFLHTAFDYAALATADEAPRLSLRYCDALIGNARAASSPANMSYALRRRAELLARLGQVNSARRDIDSALAAARQIDTTGRSKQIADVLIASAQLDLPSAPAVAESKLRQVIDEYRSTRYELGLSVAYLRLATATAATGRIDQARVAFDSATSLMQRQRKPIANDNDRATFMDAARDAIDQIVAFHAGHNARDAFEYFETNRSRVLLEKLDAGRGHSNNGSPSISVLAALQRSLAPDDVVLSYAVLPNELLIWVIGPHRFEQHRVPVGARDLQGTVERFRQSLLDGSNEPDIGLSKRLYEVLLDSAGRIDHGANLIVIPDASIHFVPFVALRDPVTGRYLVRDHAVQYAPSAALLATSLSRRELRFSHATKILALGNPAFDQRTFQLPYLPSAEGEARRIASLYSNGTILTGPTATDVALERLAPSFEIVHFAGHAIVGRETPDLSHLVLASEGGSKGVVFTNEIARWKLARTRLVILSGCSTAGGMLSATEGPSSLARAFFAAGVPDVVSSLWSIDDDDTADFFVAFHKLLAQGVPVSAALHETQIKWLGGGPTPAHPVRSWAAFQLFGE